MHFCNSPLFYYAYFYNIFEKYFRQNNSLKDYTLKMCSWNSFFTDMNFFLRNGDSRVLFSNINCKYFCESSHLFLVESQWYFYYIMCWKRSKIWLMFLKYEAHQNVWKKIIDNGEVLEYEFFLNPNHGRFPFNGIFSSLTHLAW